MKRGDMSKNPTAIPMHPAPAGTLQIRTAKMRILLSPYGARIREFWLRNDDGTETNITVGLPDDDAYATHDSYIGAVCGRYANRIANSAYIAPNGDRVTLAANEGPTHLHGGVTGFDRHDWSVTQNTDHEIAFHLQSPDGDQGYPGNFAATATYSIVAENRLRLEITATCDQTCPVNMTSHAYWNLTGRFDKCAALHILEIDADAYLPIDDHLIPLPGRKDVAGTGYDFRNPTVIAQNLLNADQGVDHNFCIKGARGPLKQIATLSDPDSGRTMKLFSTEAGLQFYLSQHFTNPMKTPDGKSLHKSGGIALEPQTFPDSPNRPDFPSPWLKPGETYTHVIEWEF
jgi:aldose 1-epimerase